MSSSSDDDNDDNDGDLSDSIKTKGDPDPLGTKSSSNPQNIVTNVMKMMYRRQYHDSPMNPSLNKCIELVRSLSSKKGQNVPLFFLNDDEDVVMIVFILKLSTNDFRKIMKIMEDKDIRHCIFIVFGTLPKVKNFASDMLLGSQKIEILRAMSLFEEDIIENPFVPKHFLLTNVERTEFLGYYDPKKLPVILLNDPIASYYGANVGDIFRINLGDELSPYYRIVSDVYNKL